MSKLLILGGVALVVFGASAGVSYYLKEAQQQAEAPGTPASPRANARSQPAPPRPQAASPGPLTPAVRTPYNPAAEEIVRLKTQIKDSQDRINAEEKRLENRKKLLELVHDDIRKERNSIEQKRSELNELLKSVDERVNLLESRHQELEQKIRKHEELIKVQQKSLTAIDTVEQQRIKQLATMYDSMDPVQAGQILQQMADTGNMDTAAKILASMKERQAGRVISEIPDRGVVVQLMDRLKTLKRPEPGSR